MPRKGLSRNNLNGKGQNKSTGAQRIKKPIDFLAVILIIFRLGAYVPVPGLDPVKLAQLLIRSKMGF